MIWLSIYLGIGAIVLVMAWGQRWWGEWRDWRTGAGRADLSHAAAGAPRHRVPVEFLAPAIISLGVVLAWPLLVVLVVRSWLAPTVSVPAKVEPTFAVAPGDLVEALTVQDIERRERVSDPLGAVPDLPFGHLNPAWRRFLDGLEPADRIWSFRTLWAPYRDPAVHLGYAGVRDGVVVAHLLVERRQPDTPAPE